MQDDALSHEEHFESAQRQREAATFGMWLFLASELLFFGALFATYAFYRAGEPAAFAALVEQNTLYLGSLNTCVLLTSSFCAALGVHALRHARVRAASGWVWATAGLGVVFFAIKMYEYHEHISKGILPGGQGAWFTETARPEAAPVFWTLYYAMTGLHAVHVVVGVGLMSVLALLVRRGRVLASAPQALENGALYWHLVDIIWLFLWPCFYLTRSP